MKHNELGFTLIEVMASIVIISILLLSFSLFFINGTKQANHNTEKLVVIHLADGYYEKMRITPFSEIKDSDVILLNNKTYTVSIKKNATSREQYLNLVNLVITVTAPESNAKGVVEGYVEKR